MVLRAVGDALQRRWWSPRLGPVTAALLPLSALYAALAAWQARRQTARAWRAPCPVLVVGNLVVGGAGKTPTVIALVRALQAAGHRPGVVSRGYGRRAGGIVDVQPDTDGRVCGDEPLLIRRATGAPVVVATRRVDAARHLLAGHPQVDLLIADDGLQHRALARDAEVWVFDERGVGNGALLPAGPLREVLPAHLPDHALVLYNAPAPSTPLPGPCARRRLAGAVALADWHAGKPMQPELLSQLRGRRLVAIAGIAAPQRFFRMLVEAGLDIDPTPLPDHAAFDAVPWPIGAADVVCTEKDAVKLDLRTIGETRVWVVGLDFELPSELISALCQRLAPPEPPCPSTTA